MVKKIIYPTIEEALYLHQQLIIRFGGDGGVRDLGLLEGAIARASSGYYDSLSEQAAAILHSLALNHPFVDGNKRMAFSLAVIFLRLNGYNVSCSAAEGDRLIVEKVIVKKFPLSEIAAWFEKHMEEL